MLLLWKTVQEARLVMKEKVPSRTPIGRGLEEGHHRVKDVAVCKEEQELVAATGTLWEALDGNRVDVNRDFQ